MAFCFSLRGASIDTLGTRGFLIKKGNTAFHFEARDKMGRQAWITAIQRATE